MTKGAANDTVIDNVEVPLPLNYSTRFIDLFVEELFSFLFIFLKTISVERCAPNIRRRSKKYTGYCKSRWNNVDFVRFFLHANNTNYHPFLRKRLIYNYDVSTICL